jgi:hypothetical protein
VGDVQIKDSQKLQDVCRALASSNLETEAEECSSLKPGTQEYDQVER